MIETGRIIPIVSLVFISILIVGLILEIFGVRLFIKKIIENNSKAYKEYIEHFPKNCSTCKYCKYINSTYEVKCHIYNTLVEKDYICDLYQIDKNFAMASYNHAMEEIANQNKHNYLKENNYRKAEKK